jgi:hypothetical protein
VFTAPRASHDQNCEQKTKADSLAASGKSTLQFVNLKEVTSKGKAAADVKIV